MQDPLNYCDDHICCFASTVIGNMKAKMNLVLFRELVEDLLQPQTTNRYHLKIFVGNRQYIRQQGSP